MKTVSTCSLLTRISLVTFCPVPWSLRNSLTQKIGGGGNGRRKKCWAYSFVWEYSPWTTEQDVDQWNPGQQQETSGYHLFAQQRVFSSMIPSIVPWIYKLFPILLNGIPSKVCLPMYGYSTLSLYLKSKSKKVAWESSVLVISSCKPFLFLKDERDSIIEINALNLGSENAFSLILSFVSLHFAGVYLHSRVATNVLNSPAPFYLYYAIGWGKQSKSLSLFKQKNAGFAMYTYFFNIILTLNILMVNYALIPQWCTLSKMHGSLTW